jgi:DNA-binding protein H-NS
MKKKAGLNLDAMSVDEMWELYAEIGRVLSDKLISEKSALETRLAQLQRRNVVQEALGSRDPSMRVAISKQKRRYPRVVAKYRNPNEPSETWSGRGKTPRWLAAALKTGRRIEEFRIRSDPA